MNEGEPVGLVIAVADLPLLAEALDHCRRGLKPGGLGRNRAHRAAMVDLEPGVPAEVAEILYDPQTSGGLLAAVPAAEAHALVERMRAAGITDAAIVGEVVAEPAGRIVVR
jgi:selenide,water dikinase